MIQKYKNDSRFLTNINSLKTKLKDKIQFQNNKLIDENSNHDIYSLTLKDQED